jgi:hypothetical protein
MLTILRPYLPRILPGRAHHIVNAFKVILPFSGRLVVRMTLPFCVNDCLKLKCLATSWIAALIISQRRLMARYYRGRIHVNGFAAFFLSAFPNQTNAPSMIAREL